MNFNALIIPLRISRVECNVTVVQDQIEESTTIETILKFIAVQGGGWSGGMFLDIGDVKHFY